MAQTTRSGDHLIEVTRYGPGPAEIEQTMQRLVAGPLRDHLDGARYRWLSFRVDDELDGALPALPAGPQRFRATLYDYSRERSLRVDGLLDELGSAQVATAASQPQPTRAEWLAAVDRLRADAVYGPLLRSGAVHAYRPMPPYVTVPLPGGRSQRALTIGLRTAGPADALLPGGGGSEEFTHRVVAMVMATGRLYTDYLSSLPESSDCGSPPAFRGCEETGFSGQALVVVRDTAGNEVWRLLVVRPAGSSAMMGSGIELRHVSHRGTPVLRRAHVPLVNVQYLLPVGCGPTYRDWVNEETCFQADGADVAPGFRVVTDPPQTIIETGTDEGNFRGVAIHLADGQLRLTSEVEAGWYRYPLVWRLTEDGRISPRFGFDAASNPCTCQTHVHHGYFRFDFGARPQGSRVEEFNDPGLDDQDGNLHVLEYEAARLRDTSRKRHWRVSDIASGRGYRLVPGEHDGDADLYGAGDAWFLRYHPDEIDDGQGFTTDPVRSRAGLDDWVDGERIDGEEVVAWYGAHFIHDPGTPGRYAGPELEPFQAQPGGTAAAATSAKDRERELLLRRRRTPGA